MLAAREGRVLVATAVAALGVPLALAAGVRARTDAVAEALSEASGLPVTIGRVDADLTGSIRLGDVAFGALVAAESIEASVAMSSLLGGQLRADEIRVSRPRLTVAIDRAGDSDLAALVRNLASRGRPSSDVSAQRVRRIVVTDGTLAARIAGVGELTAADVELVPDPSGVRIVTGETRLRGSAGLAPLALDIAFARTAAEVALPQMKFDRVLAVGGAGMATFPDRDGRPQSVLLASIAAGRRERDGALEVRATLDDGGTPRPIEIDLAPSLTVTLRGERVPLRLLAALAPRGVNLDRARVSGELALRRDPARTAVVVDGRIEGLRLEHPLLAPAALPLDADVAGELAITPAAITMTNATFGLGAVKLSSSGWLARRAPTRASLSVALDSAPCEMLLAALPRDVREPLDGLALAGKLGGRAQLAIDLSAPEGAGATLATSRIGGCTVLGEPPAADVTTLAERPTDEAARARWVTLKSLPDHVPGAFVSAEDGRFWTHDGFDLEQIARSIEIDLRERRLARGGSTISQQLVKNAFLTHRRTLDRKLQEAVLTWRLEDRLSKKQILERYLNIIELGPKVFGLREAARYWFDTTPGDLSVRQAAFLAALTSQPTTMARRVRKAGGLDEETHERIAVVLRAMRRDGVLSNDDYDVAKHAPMRFSETAIAAER